MNKSQADKVLPASVQNALDRLLDRFGHQRADGEGRCSVRTRHARRLVIRMAFAHLWINNFQVRTPEGLKSRHIDTLMRYWDALGVSASELHTRLSMLRTLAGWLGKPEIVGDMTDYVSKERAARSTIAKTNRSWEANGVEPAKVIEEAKLIDERMGAMLWMQHAFGLRVKEAIEIRPNRVLVDNGKAIEIFEGTKGGRLRRVPIETEYQQQALDYARQMAAKSNTGRLRWGTTFRQAKDRYYTLAKRLGMTKRQLGVTAHGLRHSYAQAKYRRETGLPTPIEGGNPSAITREAHLIATLSTSHALGHGRPDVGPTYYGSYGHALRTVSVPLPDKMAVSVV